MRNRDDYFDFLRGFAITLVVAIHSANLVNLDRLNADIFLIVWRVVIGFAVPLFVSLSGYFLTKTDLSNRHSYTDYLKRQLPRVLLPFVIWSTFYSTKHIVSGGSITSAITNFVTFQAVVPMYFIALVIQFYFLAPFAQKFANLSGLAWTALLSLVFCAAVYYVRYYTGVRLPVIIYAGTFFPYLFFYILGVYLASGARLIKGRRLALILTVLTLIGAIIDAVIEFRQYHNIKYAVSTIKVTSLVYAFFACYTLLAFRWAALSSSIVSYLGIVSFGVFFIHVFLLDIFFRIQTRYLHIDNQLLLQFLIIGGTLSISLVFAICVRRIFGKKATKYLGF